MLDARESTEAVSGEIDLLQSPKLDLRTVASIDLGVRATSLVHSLDIIGSTEHLSAFEGGTESMTNNQEGTQNAELFKRTYDLAVESIDGALQTDVGELSGKIPAILSSIDALLATPYISSAPEFVAMVEAAKSTIEAVDTLNGEDTDLIVANALSQAKHQLSGTSVAYRPQR